ncbi:3-phytase [Durotheca rogersii]|uniref:3-phytase n=1 Tax=Durotheca rogersii TaxID=419775 RepID=UPI00221FBEE4|nr:3-phytase [Durotheca rogersii]KAI5865394.1 3-phytase [Durotheca rogersii]
MRFLSLLSASLATCVAIVVAGTAPEAELPISARSGEVESDWTAVFYDTAQPKLVGNDGGAGTGGFRVFGLNGEDLLSETKHEKPGRTKLVTTVYAVGGNDLIVTIAQPDSYFRLYDATTVQQVGEPLARTLGDWSALCSWRSQTSGQQYLYLFGKRQAVQFLLRKTSDSFEIVEIQTFETPIEASSCAVSFSARSVYFSGDDSPDVYTFNTTESTAAPNISVPGEADDDVTGLATYIGLDSDYLLVALEDSVAVYDTSLALLGSMKLTGDDDIEVQGLSVYQAPTQKYPAGALVYAIESDAGAGFAVSSLEAAFVELGLELNTAYNPRKKLCKPTDPVCAQCNSSGFCLGAEGVNEPSCACFAGFEGANCAAFTCRNDCSGHGECVGANTCQCDEGWGGLYCGFKVARPVAETDANGGDGDDPAIWISPTDKSESRIITTTKSEVGAGLGVFDLSGKLLQTIPAEEPNNVDIIYNFQAGDRVIDLAYAACRADNTLCLFEMTADGTLKTIAGGIQPTKDDYDVYGSCVYRSRKTGKQYLFANAKTAEYLQFELSWVDDALQTTLVRNFTGGSGGQVEGCVSDEANGWVFIGEEPRALWRYGAEPDDDSSEGFLIGEVGDGKMFADVEGVTLVEGPSADKGFIIVSQQGVSAYNVYRRAAPHEYVETFTIYENSELGIDAVTNTDGVAAVGASLGAAFPDGLVVVHDDANEVPEGGTSDEASFKLVKLGDVLEAELLEEVDKNWDPRAV